MNNRFFSLLLLFFGLPIFGAEQEIVQKGSLDRIEQNLQSAWQSFWGIAKTEGDNAGALTARGTGIGASILNFWDNHPKVFKILLGSAVVVGAARSEQYLSVKEHLDRARVFCNTSLPGKAEPRQRDTSWKIYSRTGARQAQLDYCNALILNLAGSSWLKSWAPGLAQAHNIPNFNVENINCMYDLLSIQAVKDEIMSRSAALGTLQYRHWLDTFGTWGERLAATWTARREVGFFKSFGTALIRPYDGEATMLTLRLLEIKRELSS